MKGDAEEKEKVILRSWTVAANIIGYVHVYNIISCMYVIIIMINIIMHQFIFSLSEQSTCLTTLAGVSRHVLTTTTCTGGQAAQCIYTMYIRLAPHHETL